MRTGAYYRRMGWGLCTRWIFATRRVLPVIISIAVFPQVICGQSGPFESRILAGFNFGAAAPVPIPDNIRAINAWWPSFSPSLGYELTYKKRAGKWGASVAAIVNYTGMGTKSEVLYVHTIITVEDGSQKGTFEGTFSGRNKTISRNAYFSFPISAVWTPGKKWRYQLGAYVAWLFSGNFHGNVSDGYIRNGSPVGEKINIDEATFDFNDEVRKFDWGLQGGASMKTGPRIAVAGDLSWGLVSIFPSSFRGMTFKLQNIFLKLGITYRLP